MEDTGGKCRVSVLLLLFLGLVARGATIDELAGGHGTDSLRSDLEVISVNENRTSSRVDFDFSSDHVVVAAKEDKRDPGNGGEIGTRNGNAVADGDGGILRIGNVNREEEIEEESRSSGGGSKLSLHEGEAAEVSKSTFELSHNHERRQELALERKPSHAEYKEVDVIDDAKSKEKNRKPSKEVNGDKSAKKFPSAGNGGEYNKKENGLRDLVRRDIELPDKDQSVTVASDRMDSFPSGITLIHPGQGGILPVFSPELAAEESQEFPRVAANQFQTNENRKQDLFMGFRPILFQQVFPNNVRFRPTLQNRPRQPQRLNQGQQNIQRPFLGRFPNNRFRNPHLMNNNMQINTHRPVVMNEFRQPHQTLPNPFPTPVQFNNFNHSLGFRSNGQGRFPVLSRPTQVAGPWSFVEEERPQSNGPLEEFEIRLPENIPPGSVVFEPPDESGQQRPPMHFSEFENRRPNFNQENHHEARRPHQGNQFEVPGSQQRPWNAFVQVVEKKPTRPSFSLSQTPTRRPMQSVIFNPVTGQKLVTRQPLNTPAPHLLTPSLHFHPQNSPPMTTTPRPQFNVEQFFVPSKDTSNLPFDFPSSFANSNEGGQNHHFVSRPSIQFTSDENPEIKQTRPWFTPHSIAPFSRRPEMTTSRPLQPPRPFERPVTEVIATSRPFELHTDKPSTFPHSPNIDDHSKFTPSFVPTTTMSTRPMDNNFRFENQLVERDPSEQGITVQPDPAIIPPKPPFLNQFHRPSYIIPPLKVNRTTTMSESTTPQNNFFQTTLNSEPSTMIHTDSNSNILNHNMPVSQQDFVVTTPNPRHVNQFSNNQNLFHQTTVGISNNNNLITHHVTNDPSHSISTSPNLFNQNDQFFTRAPTDQTTLRQTQPQSTIFQPPVNHDFRQTIPDIQTTESTPGSTVATTLNSPQQQNNHEPEIHATTSTPDIVPGGLPMNKFLTPLVNFRDTVTEDSFVPNSAVKITPKAVATPEFSFPKMKPASPNNFIVSTNFPLDAFDDEVLDEEIESLMTPDSSRATDENNFDFSRTSTSTPNFIPTTSTSKKPHTTEDNDWMKKLHTNIPKGFFSSTFPKKPMHTTKNIPISTMTSFTPSLRFPNQNTISTSRPPPPRITTFRPSTMFNNFQLTDHFVHSTPGRLPPNDVSVPLVGSQAMACNADACQLPNCFCGSNNRIPGDLSANEVPQLVLLTFDDDVNEVNWNIYKKILYTGRQNPNGCPIQTTFYISHEWTDYSKVQTLYADGHEIASHSISHPDGASYTKQKWTDEIQGQREILSFMGGVPIEDIQGMRAPFLAVGGNKMFGMLYDSNFTYDSSLPVPIHDPPFWPYTLDYSMGHDCMIPPCPRKSFPGVWEIPMVMWVDLKGGRCSMADACSWPETKERVYETLMKNFQRHYKSNRAPFNLFYHSAWFDKPQNMAGFLMFMDRLLMLPDVYFVTSMQAIEWMRQPIPLREIHNFVPFSCHLRNLRVPKCKKPRECQLKFRSETRYVRTCQECPSIYPWIKNPHGKA